VTRWPSEAKESGLTKKHLFWHFNLGLSFQNCEKINFCGLSNPLWFLLWHSELTDTLDNPVSLKMALGDFDADQMHIYYLRNRVFLFPIFHCRKEKLSLYFTFFPYVLVILFFCPYVCWKMEKLFKCMSDYYSMKNILHMTMDGSHGKSCGGDITPAKFLYSLCVHYCNIQCYTFLCACMCLFFFVWVSIRWTTHQALSS